MNGFSPEESYSNPRRKRDQEGKKKSSLKDGWRLKEPVTPSVKKALSAMRSERGDTHGRNSCKSDLVLSLG